MLIMPDAWYPHAQRRPLGEQTEPALNNPSIICLHTMVGSLWGTDRYFHDQGYGGTESHFGVGYDGEILQWQDLDHQADANLDGNHRVISIETSDYDEPPFGHWDTGDPSQVPAWTAAQIEAIAQLVAWLCDQHGIPCVLIPDSRPERRGVGYHRQGIDNWRVSGGEKWSSYTGKVCPGDRRVAQVPQVIARAKQILAGEEPDQPEPPPEEDEDDMKTKQFGVQDDPVGATYSINWLTVQHVPDPSWQDVEQRLELLPEGGAEQTINNVQMEWAMKNVLEAGGTVACPKHCGACLLETRWKAWADASNDRAAIADLQSTLDDLVDGEG